MLTAEQAESTENSHVCDSSILALPAVTHQNRSFVTINEPSLEHYLEPTVYVRVCFWHLYSLQQCKGQ